MRKKFLIGIALILVIIVGVVIFNRYRNKENYDGDIASFEYSFGGYPDEYWDYKIYTENEFLTAVKLSYEEEHKRLQAEPETEEKVKEKETELDALKNVFRNYFAPKFTVEETAEEIAAEPTAAEPTEKEREFDSIRNALKKRFGQKNHFDEYTDAIAVLENIVL